MGRCGTPSVSTSGRRQGAAAALSQLDQARAAIVAYDAQRQESKRDDDTA